MDKDMNKFLFGMVKYDLIIGIFICMSIGVGFSFQYSKIYFFGICVALINFICSFYSITKFLTHGTIFLLISILRIIFILITVMPFMKNINYIIYYMIGFVSHYIIHIIFGIKNMKGSD